MTRRLLRGLILPAFLGALLGCTREPGDLTDPNPAPPASLEISGALSAQAGQTVPLSAVLRDSAGNVLSGSVTWSSSDSTLIAVAADGTVTALRIGSVVITAASDSLIDTVVFTSSLSPYVFLFADTISAADRQIIRDGIQYAHAYHQAAFGRAIADSTTIAAVFSAAGCAQGGAAAFAGGRSVTFCLGNQGWRTHGPIIKQKIVQHELFHIWQFSYWGANINASSAWIIEGSAELMGFRGLEVKGLLPLSTALGCQLKESADFANRTPPGPPLPALSTVETRQAFQGTMGPLYTHSMLAMDNLTAAGGVVSLRAYGDSLAAGKSWSVAFESAFGKTPAAFYGQFPGYVSGLTVPGNYLCRI